MIYLILSAGFKDNNPDQFEKRLKIGYTDNLENRLKAYLTTNPDFILLQTMEGDITIESYLHKKFEKYRYKDSKEWFYYNQEIIDHFQDEVEDFIDEGILLECIKKDLRSKIASVPELKEKYLNQILDEIKSLDEFDEELYDEEAITRVILDVWELGINLFNKAIDNIELINYQPIDLLKIDNPEITVDITLDLPQILGRQRLDCNPWKNRAELYAKFLSDKNKKTTSDFKKYISKKIKKTNELLNVYSSVVDNSTKHTLAENYQKVAKTYNYKDDFVAVNTHSGKDLAPVFNNLAMVSELRAFQIQQVDFADRFRLFNTINLCGEISIDEELSNCIRNFIIQFNYYKQYVQKMKFLCESELDKKQLSLVLTQIPIEYSTHYNILGPDRLKSLSYRRCDIEKECSKVLEYQPGSDKEKIIYSNFSIGDKLTLQEIKETLKNLYLENNIKSSPKAVDLLNYFEVMKTRAKDKETGKFVAAYKILKIKEK